VTANLVLFHRIGMWKVIAGHKLMHKTRCHSKLVQILGNHPADKVLSAPSPAMKAEYKSLYWLRLVTKMTSHCLDDCITD